MKNAIKRLLNDYVTDGSTYQRTDGATDRKVAFRVAYHATKQADGLTEGVLRERCGFYGASVTEPQILPSFNYDQPLKDGLEAQFDVKDEDERRRGGGGEGGGGEREDF